MKTAATSPVGGWKYLSLSSIQEETDDMISCRDTVLPNQSKAQLSVCDETA